MTQGHARPWHGALPIGLARAWRAAGMASAWRRASALRSALRLQGTQASAAHLCWRELAGAGSAAPACLHQQRGC